MNQEVKIMPPQKTWFFEGADGKPFPVNEKEADSLLNCNSRWRRQDLKMIGMSDGTTYHEYVKSGQSRILEMEKSVKEKQEMINRFIKTEDRLVFEEVADDDDERLVKVRQKIKALQDEFEPLKSEYDDLRSNIIKKAEEAELEKARGNIVAPKRFNVITRGDKVSGVEGTINAMTQ